MGSTTKVKVSEIFSQAGSAFSRLGELTMQLQNADDGSCKWTDEEIDMLNVAIGRFCSDLSEISFRVKNRGVTQLKQNLKKKAFEDAGIPVKQVALVSATQPAQPVAVPAQPQTIQSFQPVQFQSNVQTIQQFQNVQAIPPLQQQSVVQNVQQYHQMQTSGQQQYQLVQKIQQVPMLAQLSQPIQITDIASDDLNDSQDEDRTTPADGKPMSSLIGDQSLLTLNSLNVQSEGGEHGEGQFDEAKLEMNAETEEMAG